jgi:GGDEF domain-containing protein
MDSNYRLAMIAAAVVTGISVIGFSAGSDDVGGTLWTISLMGIALGLLVAAAAYSLGTRSQFASETHHQQDSISQMQDTFESLAGKDWMTGLDTFSEISNQVARELSRAIRYDRVFSVMFVTPRFEGNTAALGSGHISDIEIYAAGILREVLRLSDGIARRTDVFGFAALLPETDATGGQIAGRRVTEALENPYRVGPWDDQAEMIALDAEVLSFPDDESAIASRFGIERPEPGAPAGTTLPPNV